MSQKSAIVIVGGGGAGVDLAQKLDKVLDPSKHTLTLLTERDFYRHLPASLRAIVTSEGDLESKICIPYDKIFGKDTDNGTGRVGTVKVGKVIGVEEKSEDSGYVLLEGNQRIEWNILVIATGSEWEGPLNWPNRTSLVKPYLDIWREKFASARSIVLVGAGAVGCELAGEIRDFIPGAELSVVQKDSLVLNPTYPESFRRRVQKGLEERGVRVLTGDSVVHLEQGILDGTSRVVPGKKFTTTSGVTLPAELIVCTTRFVSTEPLRTDHVSDRSRQVVDVVSTLLSLVPSLLPHPLSTPLL
jgi:NADH dehydrogenase FAD-containing subunit